ncbi:MAG: PEP-CTERM sorting domain-containing protein [Bryobacterales bacterium]|nr:PEP-CTERM sorting domain-containing protein [Bryobacterales bacterium]
MSAFVHRNLAILMLLLAILLPREGSAAITYHITGEIFLADNAAPLINVGDTWHAVITIDENDFEGFNPWWYKITSGVISFPSGLTYTLSTELGLVMSISPDMGSGDDYLDFGICCYFPDMNGEPFAVGSLYLYDSGGIDLTSFAPPVSLDLTQWDVAELTLQWAGIHPENYVSVSGTATSLTSVPEPATYGLFVAGMVTMCVRRFRQQG